MKIDLVIPLKDNTKYDCKELRYSLRSVEKHLHNLGQVFIVADELPTWLTGVIHIYGKDYLGLRNKEMNICTKFCSACLDERVSDPFITSNDDIYLMTDFDGPTFPYYYFGTIDDRLKLRKPNEIYYKSMFNTKQALLDAGKAIKYFDLHCPIVYSKVDFMRVIKSYSWRNNCGYIIKSLYCALQNIPGIEYPDLKMKVPFNPALLENRKFFSNCNLVLNAGLFDTLESLFPTKSKYEK